MNVILKGQLIKVFGSKTKKDKEYEIIQVLTNSGKSATLNNVDNFGKPFREKIGSDVEIPVRVHAYKANNGNVGLNCVLNNPN